MPKKKYYRVGGRPPPRGPIADGLWQPPPRQMSDDAAAPAPAPPKSTGRRRRSTRRSLRITPREQSP